MPWGDDRNNVSSSAAGGVTPRCGDEKAAWHGMAMCYSEVHEATESRHSRVAWRRWSGESPVDVSALGRDVCTYVRT